MKPAPDRKYRRVLESLQAMDLNSYESRRVLAEIIAANLTHAEIGEIRPMLEAERDRPHNHLPLLQQAGRTLRTWTPQ